MDQTSVIERLKRISLFQGIKDDEKRLAGLVPKRIADQAELALGQCQQMIEQFGEKIEHVHWKDLPEKFLAQRGKVFGCGMSLTELGKGVIGIEKIYRKLESIGYDGYSTLEIAGPEAVLGSYKFLKELGAE